MFENIQNGILSIVNFCNFISEDIESGLTLFNSAGDFFNQLTDFLPITLQLVIAVYLSIFVFNRVISFL